MVISTFPFPSYFLIDFISFFVCSRDSCFRKKLNLLDSVEVFRKISDIVVRGRGFLLRFYHRLHFVLFHGQLDVSLFLGVHVALSLAIFAVHSIRVFHVLFIR